MSYSRSERGQRFRHLIRSRHGTAVCVLLATALIGLQFAGCGFRGPAAPESPTAAVVDRKPISIAELDQQIKDELFQRSFPPNRDAALYEARRTALDQSIDALVVAAAARQSGDDPTAWLDAEAKRRHPVTDEEIEAFFESNRARVAPEVTLDDLREDIRAFLLKERAQQIVTELRAESNVRVLLARPRHAVQAMGPSRGPANAPITMVEFSDFQCPFCKRVHPTIQQILEKYPEEVQLFYRHLPLPNHPRARPAAIASICAGRQDSFWAYHDRLFEAGGGLTDEELRNVAIELDLEVDAFDACLTEADVAAEIDVDVAAAEAAGVTGTPVFFINGIRVTGAQPLDAFQRVIDEELAARR